MTTTTARPVLKPTLGRQRLTRSGHDLAWITDTDQVCNGFRRKQGEAIAGHFPAGDFRRDELLDLFRFSDCPLHVHPDYPSVPEGVWKRDVHNASVMIDHIIGNEPTRATIRSRRFNSVWRAAPHARWWFERFEIPVPPLHVTACLGDGEAAPCDCDAEDDGAAD